MTFRSLMKYFKKLKWRTRSNLKSYESEENRNWLGNVKVREKRQKIFQA